MRVSLNDDKNFVNNNYTKAAAGQVLHVRVLQREHEWCARQSGDLTNATGAFVDRADELERDDGCRRYELTRARRSRRCERGHDERKNNGGDASKNSFASGAGTETELTSGPRPRFLSASTTCFRVVRCRSRSMGHQHHFLSAFKDPIAADEGEGDDQLRQCGKDHEPRHHVFRGNYPHPNPNAKDKTLFNRTCRASSSSTTGRTKSTVWIYWR